MVKVSGKWAIAFAVVGIIGCSKKITKTEQIIPDKKDTFAAKPAVELQPKTESVRINDLLATIYFDYDQFTLRYDAVRVLEKVGPYLANHSSVTLQTAGHCDERGSSEYNMGLGEKRANAIKQWLVAYGISGNRIETTSYGRERPASVNCNNDDCHAANRRVEWKVLSGSADLAVLTDGESSF